MVFPKVIAGFTRSGVNAYNADRSDISVGYNLVDPPSGAVIATVYVYPTPKYIYFDAPRQVIDGDRRSVTDPDFAARKAEIVGAHPDARLITDEPATCPGKDPSVIGRHAV